MRGHTPVMFDLATCVLAEEIVAVNRFRGSTNVHLAKDYWFGVDVPLHAAITRWREGLAGKTPILVPLAPDVGPARLDFPAQVGVAVEAIELGPGDGLPVEDRMYPHEILVLRGKVSASVGPTGQNLKAGDRIAFPGGAAYGINALEKSLVVILKPQLQLAMAPPPPPSEKTE